MERLNKYISDCGIASRRKSDELILEGRVKVNNIIIKELGYKINTGDVVTIDDDIITRDEKLYYLLYKPEKTICSLKDEKGRNTVIDLIDTKERIFPVGRLDYDTSGILLLTNDGELTNALTHPSKNIKKTYIAKIEGIIMPKEIKLLENGILIDGIMTKKAYAKIKRIDKKHKKSYVEITITEGRNHQVKNMFMYFGYKVLKLKRVSYSFLDLKGLKKGEYRKLTIKEIKQLYNECKIKKG